MPTIILTLSDAAAAEVIDAICASHLYAATINGAPNPETRAQFSRRMLRNWVVEQVKQYRRNTAVTVAVDAVDPTEPDVTV